MLGPSGSGKSTLLALMAGLDRPTAGEVLLDGEPIQDLSEDRLALLRRHKIGFVFQSYQLLANLTARENVLLPLELLGVAGARARADELLATVGLGERGHHYPSQLSGGEQQRVALARAFAAPAAGAARRRAHRQPRQRHRRSGCWRSSPTSAAARAPPWCWSPTTRRWPTAPTAWSTCATGGSSATSGSPDDTPARATSASPGARPRGSRGRIAFFVACLAVGVAAVVAVAGLAASFDAGIRAQARPLLAADLAVHGRRPPPRRARRPARRHAGGRAAPRCASW